MDFAADLRFLRYDSVLLYQKDKRGLHDLIMIRLHT